MTIPDRRDMQRIPEIRHHSPSSAVFAATAGVGCLDDAVAGLRQPFVVLDAAECLISWNPAYADLHREKDGTCILQPGMPISEITAWRLRSGFFFSATENNNRHQIARDHAHFEAKGALTYQLGDGRWMLVERYPLPDGRNVGLWIDITVLKRTEAELSRAQTALQGVNEDLERRVQERTSELLAAQDEILKQQRLSVIGQLTATVAHELRNPMSAIRNTVYALKEIVTVGDPRFERPLARIERSIGRCDKIIEELLDYSRTREPRLELRDLDQWLGEITADMTPPPGIAILLEPGALKAQISLDPDRLRRVVINLVENAAQALAEVKGGVAAPQIVVRSRARDDYVEFDVEDNGPGIPAENLAKVFEPLFSTKRYGTGLGLPTVKQIILQHGGDIELTSVVGDHTRARVRLPLAR